MKRQDVATVKAVESNQSTGDFPVNLKFVIERKKKISSPNFSAFLTLQKDRLAADIVLNPDTSMIDAETPTIIYATRGLIYFELRVYGPSHDLHSGMFGGVIHNPAQVLCELIAGMHDDQGRVTLPGFYDKVLPLQPEERRDLSRVPLDDDYYRQQAGVQALWGEPGYSPVERVGARPSLDVNGLFSGFTGVGSKTVLPAWAMAKISMRLVPNQDPADVEQQLTRYLKDCAPPTVRWELKHLSGGFAAITDRNSPAATAMAKALQTIWGKPPVFKREGGSITVVADLQKTLGVQSVLTGFGLLDDNIHAPNEKLHLPTWQRGIDALIHFFYNLVD
jgi:acetylornithine deacetylase/succinyl-diaminopimelate desuccinylase-like protein